MKPNNSSLSSRSRSHNKHINSVKSQSSSNTNNSSYYNKSNFSKKSKSFSKPHTPKYSSRKQSFLGSENEIEDNKDFSPRENETNKEHTLDNNLMNEIEKDLTDKQVNFRRATTYEKSLFKNELTEDIEVDLM